MQKWISSEGIVAKVMLSYSTSRAGPDYGAGEKPFACENCNYKCNRAYLLRSHVMKKHPEKKKMKKTKYIIMKSHE